MAVSLSSLSRLNTRWLWFGVIIIPFLLYTYAHLNLSSSLTSKPFNAGEISYSHPRIIETENEAPPPAFFAKQQHTPQFTELAKAPLRIYIPPAPPAKPEDPIRDIWASEYHKAKIAEADEENQNEDRREYYKALNCPVCETPKPFDISHCPGVQELKNQQQECPAPVFDVSRCPGMTDSNRGNIGGSGIPPPASNVPPVEVVAAENATTTKPLISYAYRESPGARKNLAFFVNHALHENADFMFILQGETTVDIDILPKGRININIYKVKEDGVTPKTENTTETKCFRSTLGLHEQIIGKEGNFGRKSLKDTYDRFILLGGGVRGPFIPRWSQDCWSEAFLSPLREKTKLVGTSLSCKTESVPFVHPGIIATDREGLKLLFGSNEIDEHGQKKGTGGCFASEEKAQIADRFPTKVMQEKGFESVVMDERWRRQSEWWTIKCEKDEEWFKGIGIGQDGEMEELVPWEMMWISAKEGGHGHGHSLVDVLSRRVGKSGYSSYFACRQKELV